jgi:methyltransferase (TIGR00027 family)
LLGDTWEHDLVAAGFRIDMPAVFLVEGLTPYLEAEQVSRLHARIRNIAAPGSRLGVDFIGESFLRSPLTQRYLARLRELGLPWRYGTDDPAGLLAQFGWVATTAMPGDPDASWGRWPFPPAREDSPWPRVYLVRAQMPSA